MKRGLWVNKKGTRVQVSHKWGNILTKPKRSQETMSLPFGMIFAILLIVVFIVVVFIVINHFLDIGNCAQIGQFYDGFQTKVNEAWVSQQSNFNFTIDLPSGITKVCFANLSLPGTGEDYEKIKNYEFYDANVFLVLPEKACNMPYKLIKHINVTKITETKNPYCIDVSRGLKIEKGFYDKEVIVR